MSQIFLSILGLALFTWVAKYFFVLYYYRKQKENINKLEARAAVLRMLLKAKLKRKGSQMQEQYKDEKEFFSSVMPKLDLLTTFSLSRTSDYAEVVDILVSISELLDMHLVKTNPTAFAAQQEKLMLDRENLIARTGVEVARTDSSGAAKSANEIESKKKSELNSRIPKFDRWTQLLKYDKGNLYIIKEIVETTHDLKIKIEVYNSEQANKELLLPVPSVIEIEGFEGLKAIVAREQEKSKSEKESKKSGGIVDQELAEIEAATKSDSSKKKSSKAA